MILKKGKGALIIFDVGYGHLSDKYLPLRNSLFLYLSYVSVISARWVKAGYFIWTDEINVLIDAKT